MFNYVCFLCYHICGEIKLCDSKQACVGLQTDCSIAAVCVRKPRRRHFHKPPPLPLDINHARQTYLFLDLFTGSE